MANPGTAATIGEKNKPNTRKQTATVKAVKTCLTACCNAGSTLSKSLLQEYPRGSKTGTNCISQHGFVDFGRLPSLSNMLLLFATPTKVPIVSNISTKKNAKTTSTTPKIPSLEPLVKESFRTPSSKIRPCNNACWSRSYLCNPCKNGGYRHTDQNAAFDVLVHQHCRNDQANNSKNYRCGSHVSQT